MTAARIVVVMGVSGAGKTTIGQALADRLGWGFQDADALHSAANILKMAAGHALSDADRAPWLAALRNWVQMRLTAGENGVLAASLLKRRYRDVVIGGDRRVMLVYLYGAPVLLRARVRARRGHFMQPRMLESQLKTLEAPIGREHAISADVAGPLEQTVQAVVDAIREARAG